MTTDEHVNGDNRYRDALARIAAIAASVTTENGKPADAGADIGCRSRSCLRGCGSAPPPTPGRSTRSTPRCRRRWAAWHRSTRSG